METNEKTALTLPHKYDAEIGEYMVDLRISNYIISSVFLVKKFSK